MPKSSPLHSIVRLPLSAEQPICASVNFYATVQREPAFDMHYGLEMGVVLQGRMRRWLGDASYDLKCGQPWFVGMWEPHGAQAVQTPCRVLVVTIWPPLLAGLRFAEAPGVDWMKIFRCDHTAPISLDAARRNELLRLASELAAAACGTDALSRIRLHLLLMEALLLFLSLPILSSQLSKSRDVSGCIAPALELALSQRRPIRAEEAAKCCQMGRERFMRIFRARMGVSFARFSLRHRLHGAATELANTVEPIKAVARRWGFTDVSHLHRQFIRHYRCTPNAYRRLAQNRTEAFKTEVRRDEKKHGSERRMAFGGRPPEANGTD